MKNYPNVSFIMIRRSLLFLLCLCLPIALWAQSPVFDDSQDRPFSLSLDDVMFLALENSLDIQIARFDAYIERTSLKRVESMFDTFLSASALFRRDQREQVSSALGNKSQVNRWSLGISKKLPTGTSLSLEAATARHRSDSLFSSLSSYHEAQAAVRLRQELGRNFFGMSDRAKIKLTRLDIENAEFTSLDDIEEVLLAAEVSYWTLALRQEELAIAGGMLEEAKKLAEVYGDKSNMGLVEDGEFLAVQVLVEARKNSVMLAEAAREAAKNELLFILNRQDYEQGIESLDPLAGEIEDKDLPQSLVEAISSRRDYKRVFNDTEMNNINIAVSKNALWPQIDLEASFQRNNIDPKRSRAWNALPDEDRDEVFAGVTVSFPWENRQSRAELEEVNLVKEQILLRLKRIEISIVKDVNNSLIRLQALSKSIINHKNIVSLHKEKLDYQMKRFNAGRSNSDTLTRYEEDLFEARFALARALYDYRVAAAGFEALKNTMLDKYWQEPL